MTGLTDCITACAWEDVWTHWFYWVDTAYQTLERHYGAWRQRGPTPALHDSEVIMIGLIIDTWFGGHEALGLSFLRQYHPTLFPQLPAVGHFNARRTVLGPLIEQVRCLLAQHTGLIPSTVTERLVDSAPIPVATYTRAPRTTTLTGPEYFGIMPTRKAKLFGLRLTISCTPTGVIDTWCLAPAGVHDSQVLPTVLAHTHQATVLGDGAYHNPSATRDLAARAVVVYAPPRRDATTQRPWPSDLRRHFSAVRQQVETVFSTLATVFAIQRLGARSLKGVVCRISTRILAYTLCFLTPVSVVQPAVA